MTVQLNITAHFDDPDDEQAFVRSAFEFVVAHHGAILSASTSGMHTGTSDLHGVATALADAGMTAVAGAPDDAVQEPDALEEFVPEGDVVGPIQPTDAPIIGNPVAAGIVPVTTIDQTPNQPPSTPADGPLTSRVTGETYPDYLLRAQSLGAPALSEVEWGRLAVR